jgi:hypothetical protein
MTSVHKRAFVIGIIHYVASFGIGFLAFAIAWGTALSDSYHGDSGLGFLTFFLIVLQAPVALIQWLVAHFSADGKTGLQIPAIVLLAMPSSLIYGYGIAILFRRRSPTHKPL